MKTILTAAATVLALAAPAFAQDEITGDPGAGEKDFKKCKACHSIIDPDGEVIVKGGKTGPNLWGVVGRQAGTQADFGKYTDELVALGEGGLVWTPEEMAAYIPNARDFLRERSGNAKAKTSMTPQKLKDENNVIAFLAQYGPE